MQFVSQNFVDAVFFCFNAGFSKKKVTKCINKVGCEKINFLIRGGEYVLTSTVNAQHFVDDVFFLFNVGFS